MPVSPCDSSQGISFLPESAVLSPVSLPCLAEMASMLITNYEMHVEVQGQVNGGVRSGTDARKLAERRAKAVCEFMQERGVDPVRMKYTGLGSEKMLFPSGGPKGFLNRRVDVLVSEPHN